MPRVLVSDSMTRFKCNLQGCCCKGWRIDFDPEDLEPALSAFSEEEREEATRGWTCTIHHDYTLKRFKFNQDNPEQACQYLGSDNLCGLQVKKGIDVLPLVCKAFPAVGFETGQGPIELYYDAVCPEVLNQIAEKDEAYTLLELEPGPDHDLTLRAQRPAHLPRIKLGDRTLKFPDLSRLRKPILERLAVRDLPALDTLASIHYALARVAAGAPIDPFEIRPGEPAAPFEAFLDRCMTLHGEVVLARVFQDYRRFIFDIPLDRIDPGALAGHLAFDPDWRSSLDPRRADLQPLLYRYLSHRYFNCFDREPELNHMEFSYETIPYAVAMAFRYALGLSRALGGPVDATLLKVAMGSAEFLFRNLRLPMNAPRWSATP